jgi:hypothetical protein
VSEADEAAARDRWQALRDRLDSEAVAAKFSQETTVRLSAAYARLGEEERPAVNAELLEWLKADDEALRFDALALIREYRITAAESALDDLTNYRGVLACLDPRSTEASDVAALGACAQQRPRLAGRVLAGDSLLAETAGCRAWTRAGTGRYGAKDARAWRLVPVRGLPRTRCLPLGSVQFLWACGLRA